LNHHQSYSVFFSVYGRVSADEFFAIDSTYFVSSEDFTELIISACAEGISSTLSIFATDGTSTAAISSTTSTATTSSTAWTYGTSAAT